MPKIASLHAREILDSRGNPTIEVAATTETGAIGVAAVPSGASTGSHEALELRDGDKKRYGGLGVLAAVANVNGEIASTLVGRGIEDQAGIDRAMIDLDGTPNKSRLGANAMLGVSMAVCRAAAVALRQPLYRYIHQRYGGAKEIALPLPMMNVMNGGRHADFALDIQECLVIPKLASFAERVRAGSEIFHCLGRLLKEKGLPTTVGDEGGYAPVLESNQAALDLIAGAIAGAGYAAGSEVVMGFDAAASEFYDEKAGVYALHRDGATLDAAGLVAMYERWMQSYPIATIEDGLAEDDWEGWRMMTQKLGGKAALVGDDLFVTSVARLAMGLEKKVANAVLVKLNQVGTVTETLETIRLAQEHGYAVAVSHRSGETADTFIADLSAAVGADYVKTGSLSRSERTEKYNRLMAIEAELTSAL